ncbi:phosphatidylserine/phosphatidylglycerophosphate/cardiolipin synthase family protein [Sphingomonas sabuli]|uniref:Phospholipase D n=1 Tax=Sphingomonas sabuli TaxID=2764186 RepID=A0A7G9L0V1_9SPHN|nr:phosphatidylserine/phosphatidylglycerophosphate/cardiolipin synthase family protein [Sphingomonas sabuli]QNM82250.1 phosphatidylserine/phosphatidylglycerophosphate/cardiolipin synthase family protein [Sphingomonas sabuli]
MARARKPIIAQIADHRLEVIETGSGRLKVLLELIGAAETSLRIVMYMFDDDRAGKAVRDALIAAGERGVAVNLLVDGFGSSSADPEFFAKLDGAGAKYCFFHPSYGRRYLIRNHQKLIVVDDKTVLLGGSNIDSEYLKDTGPGHWRDLWLRLDGPQARNAGRYLELVIGWSHRKKAKIRSLRRIVAEQSTSRGPLQWKFSGPVSRRNSWWRSIGRDIGKARQLDMIFAYFSPPSAMLRRIGAVGSRGRARIVTAAKSDNTTTIAAARNCYSRLLRRHVEVYEYEKSKLHTKLVIVDDVVHIGSSNFDYRSLYLNLEVMLRIKDKGFADEMRRYFERELKDSRWITAQVHKQRANPWLRIKWAIAHFLMTVTDYSVTRRLNLG